MGQIKSFRSGALFAVLCAVLTAPWLSGAATAQTPVKLNLTIEPALVRFSTAGGEALDWRLEIVNAQDQVVFDTSFVRGDALTWPLADSQGQKIVSGIYRYRLTIQAERPITRQGQLLVQRTSADYQVHAISDQDALVPASAPAADPSIPRHLGSASFAPATSYIGGTGTTLSMTKWIDGPNGVLGNANVTEQNGLVVIGNVTSNGTLHIFGPAEEDIYSGMGPDVVNGPAFNFGYSGGSFGRASGFFNIRPDPLASSPNPSLRFMTADVERMMISNDGNVGIGTSNPHHKLVVQDPGDAWISLQGVRRADVMVGVTAEGGILSTTSDLQLVSGFNTYPVTIKAGGNVGIGTGSPGERLEVSGGFRVVSNAAGDGIRVKSSTPGDLIPLNDASQSLADATHRWTTVFATNGTINTSDGRLKKNVAPLTYGLQPLLQLRPVTFEWKDVATPSSSRTHLGFIAQDVEPVIPEVVERQDPTAPLGLSYTSLVPVAVKAIQEQQMTIRRQQAVVSRLTEENEALKAEVAKLEQLIQRLIREPR